MSLADTLDHALDAADTAGEVEVRDGGARARVDVVEAGKLGVRVREIEVEVEAPHDPEAVARDWPRALRDLPDRVVPVEVEPALGGASLRSDPEDRRDDTFVDVEVRGGRTRIRRFRARPRQPREVVDWTTTRDGLRRLVDTLGGSDAD